LKTSAPSSVLGTFTTVRAPYNFDGAPELGVTAPPLLDEHGAEIRAELQRRKAG
jgi:crotonobetainyl-CoA:carnitine CoA-transferase CaiB-like acyl-CoA transferase